MRYVLALLLLLATAAGAGAQATALRIVTPTGERTFDATLSRGSTRYNAQALQALGATTTVRGTTTVIAMFGDTISVSAGSPFFRAGRQVYQLAHVPLAAAGTLMLPEQFFIQWLPARYGDRVQYLAGALRLTANVTTAASTAAAAVTGNGSAPARQAPARATPPATPPVTRATAPETNARTTRIVVLDPGHGGVDPGSAGPSGLREKDVTLQIANRLAALLRTRGYQVHLTRTRDTLISLADRPAFANRWKGDEPGALYVSIHTNSFRVASASGFETFFLSEASTEDERRVAEMENASVKYEAKSPAAGKELDQVLNSLSNDFYLRASNDFASVIQKRLGAFHPGTDRGVKRAPFRVLVGALMPAVLVEVGFITNPQEGQLLGTAGFQDKLAWSIADSVDSFFRDNEHLWVRTR